MKHVRSRTTLVFMAAVLVVLSLGAHNNTFAAPPSVTKDFSLQTVVLCSDISKGFAFVDGYYADDWDLDEDFYANMYEAGKTDHDILSYLYLKYDCLTNTLYALVLCADDFELEDTDPNDDQNNWIKLEKTTVLVSNKSGNDGIPPDFAPIVNDEDDVIGWEASCILPSGYHANIDFHAQVKTDRTSRVAPKFGFPVNICCDECPDCEDLIQDGTWYSVLFPGLNDLTPPFLASSYFQSFLWLQDPNNVDPMQYPGWCVDLFTMMDVKDLFGDFNGGINDIVELYRTLNADGSSNLNVNLKANLIGTPENLAKVNYILNQFRRGYYYPWGVTWKEIQAAIWHLLSVGQASSGQGRLIISGGIGRGGFITWDNNLRDAILADAASITTFNFTPWDVVAVIVWCGVEQQVTIIEIPACYYECLLQWGVIKEGTTL